MTLPPLAQAAPGAAPAAGAPAAATPVNPGLRAAAEGLEGVFMSILVEEMMKGTEVAESNPLYAGIVTEKLGDRLAATGGLGLADLLVRQLSGAAGPAAAGAEGAS